MQKRIPAARLMELASQVPKMAPFEPRDKTGAVIPRPFPKPHEPMEPNDRLFATEDENILPRK